MRAHLPWKQRDLIPLQGQYTFATKHGFTSHNTATFWKEFTTLKTDGYLGEANKTEIEDIWWQVLDYIIYVRRGTTSKLLWMWKLILGFHKRWGVSGLFERLSAFQGMSSMNLIKRVKYLRGHSQLEIPHAPHQIRSTIKRNCQI